MKFIDRDQALSMPFANGMYDRKNANEDFINGCVTYKEWLENLPYTVNPTLEYAVSGCDATELIYNIAKMCIEHGVDFGIHAYEDTMSFNAYSQGCAQRDTEEENIDELSRS